MKFKYCVTGIILFVIMISCNSDDVSLSEVESSDLTFRQELVVDYFKEVALGFEFGTAPRITRKWNREMKLFIFDDPPQESVNELLIAIEELNSFFSDGFRITIVDTPEESNLMFFLGNVDAFLDAASGIREFFNGNLGFFNVFTTPDNFIRAGNIYVDIENTDLDKQKNIIREELTQVLGMGMDSDLYLTSIFYEGFPISCVTEFSNFDIAIIKMLYHPEMDVGLTASTVTPVLQRLVVDFIE